MATTTSTYALNIYNRVPNTNPIKLKVSRHTGNSSLDKTRVETGAAHINSDHVILFYKSTEKKPC